MSDIHCVPIYLYPAQRLQFSRCTVVPGLTIRKFEGQVAEKIRSLSKKLPEPLKVHPTHLIYIDEETYFEKLKIRLEKDGKELPKKSFLDAFSLAKQAIMALILAGRVSFSMHGNFCLAKNGNKYEPKSYAATAFFEMPIITASALLKDTGNWPSINNSKVSRYGKMLDRYYRAEIWWVDRYAMALSHFWGALCTQFADQALLGVTSSIECLLSTTKTGITHTLAERSALILHKASGDRVDKYNQVKNIYNVRSKLVHGKAFVKKGTINWDTLCVSPKMMIVPISVLAQAFDTTINVLIEVIHNKKLMSLIQTKKHEDKITKDLNDYYTQALFNAS